MRSSTEHILILTDKNISFLSVHSSKICRIIQKIIMIPQLKHTFEAENKENIHKPYEPWITNWFNVYK